MRVLLTGATGFIGSHVARLAVEAGAPVVALVRPGANLRRLAAIRDGVDVVEGDLLHPEGLADTLRQAAPDVCLHLGWYAEPGGKCLQAPENLECLQGSITLLQMLDAVGCGRLVLAGTSVEYDTSAGYVSESSPIRPGNLYAATKHALFLTAEQFQSSRGRSFAAARIFSVYGPWEDERRLVPFVIGRLLAGEPCDLTNGEQIRDYSHVEDVASALWAIARSDVQGALNVGSSQPVSVQSLAEHLGRLLGRPDLLRFGARLAPAGDPTFLVASIERLQAELGWSPRFGLADGLQHTVEWWRDHLAAAPA